MGFNGDQVGRSDPSIFGVIFMASQSTKKECLRRKLFGLPPPQINLVKKIKQGMILFLFQFEERKLYGVFEAISDGAMGIVPHAYAGKFPAQVHIRSMWNCEPLYEREFRDAIIGNYYTSNKFNNHLSKCQVSKLLALFDSRRKIPKLSPLARERLLPEKCLSRSSTRDICRKGFESDELTSSVRGRSIHAVDIETGNMHRYPGISLSNVSGVSDKCTAERSSLMFGGKGLSSSQEFRNPQLSPYLKDAVEGLFPSSKTEIIPFHLEAQNISSSPSISMRSGNSYSTSTLGDFIPLDDENQPVRFSTMLFRHENMNPSNLDAHEHSLTTSVSSGSAIFGREKQSILCSPDKDPPYVPSYQSPEKVRHEGSPCFKYKKDEHIGLRSDIENERMSVFSRLDDREKGSVKVDYDFLCTNGNGLSVNKFMGVPNTDVPYLRQRQSGRIIKESEHEVELGAIDECVISEIAFNMCEDAPLASEKEQCFEESWLNFKRRKMQSEPNGYMEESNSSSGAMLRKRRKLSRPTFVSGGTDNKLLTSDSYSSVDNSQVSSNEGACHAKERSQNSREEAVVEPKGGKAEIYEDPGEALVSSNG